MARKRRYHAPETFEDAIAPFAILLILALVGYVYLHRDQVIYWGLIALGVTAIGLIGLFVLGKLKRKTAWNFDDERVLYMLKGMSPAEFEIETAKMFDALGYKTEVVGGSNDGGIDVIAHKDGMKYFIQCKKFMTREVTPHDVRDFLGAITNVNNPADQGFFVTTGGFTVMAKEAANGNPRIELIDGLKLVEYYKMAFGKTAPANPSTAQEAKAQETSTGQCPRCGGVLVLRTAKHGDNIGKQFWGCSNFSKTHCSFIQDIP